MSLSARSPGGAHSSTFHSPHRPCPFVFAVSSASSRGGWIPPALRAVVRTPRAEPANPMPGPFLHAILLQPLHILTDCSFGATMCTHLHTRRAWVVGEARRTMHLAAGATAERGDAASGG